ncbi:MAG TPA: helix-turn-helix domain-containing protein, partial [Candidatus Polarisedimenticolia bacterium]|nr:helix-turn-helix domain-containing protein [Candidatus Polarisedimenticolia bacterium]
MPAARRVAAKKRSDATREALLDAATELFARRGFDGASVELIARKAGVNKAMINYHFRGKKGLYDAILAATFAPAGERLKEIRGSSREADVRLREFIDLFVETVAGRPHLPAMILREVLAGGTHLEDRS